MSDGNLRKLGTESKGIWGTGRCAQAGELIIKSKPITQAFIVPSFVNAPVGKAKVQPDAHYTEMSSPEGRNSQPAFARSHNRIGRMVRTGYRSRRALSVVWRGCQSDIRPKPNWASSPANS